MASAKRHKIKCLSLSNTQHSLDTFWFLLQACRYLIVAAKSGDVNTAKILVKCTNDNCSIDDATSSTPLILAADNAHVDVVRVLLEGGVNAERDNTFQWTALHYAAYYGHLDVCRLLLDWGVNLGPLNTWKDTPLHLAAWRGHLSVVKLLVERGADVRLKNDQGQTASDMARIEGYGGVAEWLDSLSSG